MWVSFVSSKSDLCSTLVILTVVYTVLFHYWDCQFGRYNIIGLQICNICANQCKDTNCLFRRNGVGENLPTSSEISTVPIFHNESLAYEVCGTLEAADLSIVMYILVWDIFIPFGIILTVSHIWRQLRWGFWRLPMPSPYILLSQMNPDLISNDIIILMWDVIIYPCPKFNCG